MLPTSLLTVVFVPLVFVRGGAALCPTNCTGKAAGERFEWWLSPEKGLNPCEVLQALFQRCVPDYQLPYMGLSAADSIDKCIEERDPVLSPCCCSTQAYALQQACWTCQNKGDDYPKEERPTLREYIQCPQNIDNWSEVYDEVDVPLWASFGIGLDDIWMPDATQKLLLFGAKIFTKQHDDDHSGDEHPQLSRLTIAAIIGSVSGLAALACVLTVVHVIRRRRRRRLASSQLPNKPGRLPAWFGRNSAAYASIESQSKTYVDRSSKEMPLAPQPTLGRGRRSGGPNSIVSSWRKNVGKEPYLPRANTLESQDFGRSTVSMIRSETESRLSVDSDESFGNSQYKAPTVVSRATHAFSV